MSLNHDCFTEYERARQHVDEAMAAFERYRTAKYLRRLELAQARLRDARSELPKRRTAA